MACCANSRPSARAPGNAKNRNPGCTRRESYSNPATGAFPKSRRKLLPEPHAQEDLVQLSWGLASGQIAREPSCPDGKMAPGSGTCARAIPLPVNSTGMPSAAAC